MLLKKRELIKRDKIKSLIQKNKLFVLAIFICAVLGDIFLTDTSSDIRYFGFLAIGISAIFLYRVSSKIFLNLALIVLLIMFFFFVTSGTSDKTEKTAVWFFLLFATGIIRQWRE